MTFNELASKKIAIVGLGKEGLATAQFLTSKGIPFTMMDRAPSWQMPSGLNLKPLKIHLGLGYLHEIEQFDFVFRSPGASINIPELKKAAAAGVVISSQTKLFFDLSPGPIIGVTGTKGKGTTATLISKILAADGREVLLGGNIGEPPLNFLDKITPNSWTVLELSSYQLMDLGKSPKIAVILMLTSEHLDYHQDEVEYREAKANLVYFQENDDFAVINHDYPNSLSFEHKTKAKTLYFSRKTKVSPGAYIWDNQIITDFHGQVLPLMETAEVGLRGAHNLENVCAAVVVGGVLGVKNKLMKEVVQEFKGLPHRLELVGEVNQKLFFDDSFSTTPETTIAALKSFPEKSVFIMGGSSKGSDFSKLGQEVGLTPNLIGLILIGNEALKIEAAIRQYNSFQGFIIKDLKNMAEIVKTADRLTPKGGTVVLSPACASFDMFNNYEDRGNQFKAQVKLLNEI